VFHDQPLTDEEQVASPNPRQIELNTATTYAARSAPLGIESDISNLDSRATCGARRSPARVPISEPAVASDSSSRRIANTRCYPPRRPVRRRQYRVRDMRAAYDTLDPNQAAIEDLITSTRCVPRSAGFTDFTAGAGEVAPCPCLCGPPATGAVAILSSHIGGRSAAGARTLAFVRDLAEHATSGNSYAQSAQQTCDVG